LIPARQTPRALARVQELASSEPGLRRGLSFDRFELG
jgi:hypothetical protein